MPLELHPALPSDIPHLISLQHAAFHRTPFLSLIYPPSPSAPTLTHAHARLLSLMRSDPSAHVLKIIDTDLPPADQIVSYGQWRIWREEREEADWKKEEKREWGEGVNARAGDVFVGRILEARRRLMRGRAHCLLNILDTHPDHQRRGAGRMIVEWGTKIADEEGLPCYLEGSEAGYRLYRQNGFEDVETLEWELEEWGEEGVCRFVCMIRPAKEK